MNQLARLLTGRVLWAVTSFVALVGLVVVGLLTGWWSRLLGPMGMWFWLVLLLFVVVAVVVGLLWFIPRYRERRFLNQLRSEDTKAPIDEVQESYRRIRDRLLEAIKTLESSPDLRRKKGMPLYALPWYLLIGASESGKTTLLRGVAATFTPFGRPRSGVTGPTQDCDWWFFNTAILLDTTSSYAYPVEVERDRARWYRFLRLLRHYRALQPINGVIIAVTVDALMSKDDEELRLDAAELRKRVDEAIRELGVDFPVYLLITRCDLLEGFTEFFNCLPEQTRRQVLGYVNEGRPRTGEASSDTGRADFAFESVYASLVDRLHQLRLSIFNQKELLLEALRQKIFCFPEEFHALQRPLSIFTHTLLAENPYQHTPFFRGLFFCSALQQGTPASFLRRRFHLDGQSQVPQQGSTSYFLHDLFAVILQRDQYLVSPTSRASTGRRLRHLLGLGGCLVLCLGLVIFLTQAFLSDRAILRATNASLCEAAEERKPVELLLSQAEHCRLEVQRFIDRRRQRASLSKLVFDRSGALERQLRQQYVTTFAADVLAPLDERLEQPLKASSGTIPLVLLLIKRIELLNLCLSSAGCPESVATEMQPDYLLMLDPAERQAPSPEQVASLQLLYETYLRWAQEAPGVLRREQNIQAERLHTWFAAKQFAPQQILLWATRKYDPVTLRDYWEKLASDVIQVDGAYTAAAWKQSIAPFLQRAAQALPETQQLLEEFEQTYRQQYFEQWHRFLTEFPRGELPWWGTPELRRQLAVQLLDEHSPYNRILDTTLENLTPLLPKILRLQAAPAAASQDAAGKAQGPSATMIPEAAIKEAESTLPAWVRVLRRYVTSENRQAYLAALQQSGEHLAGNASRDRSFQLARAGFQAGTPSAQSTHPVLKTWWILQQMREQLSFGDDSEAAVWTLLDRPVLFVWKVILEEAGAFLQQSWAENVIASTQGLSKLEQVSYLYGPQGKVREFVDQFVRPFLTANETRLGQVLGEEVPLAPTFLHILREEKQLRPVLALGRDTSYRVLVEATGDARIDSQTNLIEDKTEFLLECQANTYRVSNRPRTSATVFWSFATCGEVSITVFLTCDRSCVEKAAAVGISVSETSAFPVSKHYVGQGGFLHFIQDFRDGSEVFGRADLANAAAAMHEYGINAIRVYFRISVPSTLAKLISLVPTSLVPPSITR